jgi:hypothetical protein
VSEWIEWKGVSAFPMDPEEQTLVEFKCRDGYSDEALVGDLEWRHGPEHGGPLLDIIAYRIVEDQS